MKELQVCSDHFINDQLCNEQRTYLFVFTGYVSLDNTSNFNVHNVKYTRREKCTSFAIHTINWIPVIKCIVCQYYIIKLILGPCCLKMFQVDYSTHGYSLNPHSVMWWPEHDIIAMLLRTSKRGKDLHPPGSTRQLDLDLTASQNQMVCCAEV